MKSVIIEDFAGGSTEVSTSVYYDGIVSIDTDTEDRGYSSTMAHYTPEQARKLAAYLMEAAHSAEKGVL